MAYTLLPKWQEIVFETSVDFVACLIFCLLHSLEQRHSSTAVGLSLSVTHDMLVAYSTHPFNTTCIALKFIVDFKGILYFIFYWGLQHSCRSWSITTSFFKDKKDTLSWLPRGSLALSQPNMKLCSYLAVFNHLKDDYKPLFVLINFLIYINIYTNYFFQY